MVSKLTVNSEAPFDAYQSFMRFNHIALEGKREGSLSGYVFAVKDVFKIKGSTYSNGHPLWLNTHEPDDFTSSAIVKTLEAGADLVGKTVCDELCYSISGENWHYGSPVHPLDPKRLAGGSSAGSGVAVAGDLVDFAFGSDCLGSVRVPASYTGLLGIRPTYDRIPNDGEAPYCESMDVLGYMAKEAEVFEKVSDVLLGEDAEEVSYSKLLIPEDCFTRIDSKAADVLQPALRSMLGNFDDIEIIKFGLETLEVWVEVFQTVQGYEVWESYGGWVNKHKPTLPPGQKQRLKEASKVTRQAYEEALVLKDEIEETMEELVQPETLLCLPTVPGIAPLKQAGLKEINQRREQASLLLAISLLSGTPQVTIPLGEMEGMPLGLSLLGAKHTDRQLVDFLTQCLKDYQSFERGDVGNY